MQRLEASSDYPCVHCSERAALDPVFESCNNLELH
jgi:hypothetical protein